MVNAKVNHAPYLYLARSTTNASEYILYIAVPVEPNQSVTFGQPEHLAGRTVINCAVGNTISSPAPKNEVSRFVIQPSNGSTEVYVRVTNNGSVKSLAVQYAHAEPDPLDEVGPDPLVAMNRPYVYHVRETLDAQNFTFYPRCIVIQSGNLFSNGSDSLNQQNADTLTEVPLAAASGQNGEVPANLLKLNGYSYVNTLLNDGTVVVTVELPGGRKRKMKSSDKGSDTNDAPFVD